MLPTDTRNRFSYAVLPAPRQVAAAIKREILEGTLRSGDRLPSEPELAHMFGVSRPTLRAGLQELCSSGILTVHRGRNGGYSVAEFSVDAMEASVMESISLSLVVETLKPEAFFEVRHALELLAAGAAARRRSPAALEGLQAIAAEVHDASMDSKRAFDLDLEFHRALAAATDNPLLLTFERSMIMVLERLLGDGSTVSPVQALGGVSEVIAAVAAQDVAGARDAMDQHLSHAAAHYGLDRYDLASGDEEPEAAMSSQR